MRGQRLLTPMFGLGDEFPLLQTRNRIRLRRENLASPQWSASWIEFIAFYEQLDVLAECDAQRVRSCISTLPRALGYAALQPHKRNRFGSSCASGTTCSHNH